MAIENLDSSAIGLAENKRTMTISGTNFGKAAEDYGKYRAGFPDSIFDRLAEFDIGKRHHFVIDLGTGTGTLARGFALRGCRVIGVDPDPRMLSQARELDRQREVNIRYVEAKAESTGLATDSADIVTAGQCWHWFDQPRVIAEVNRLLRPGGKLVIAHFDWLPLTGNVVDATEQLIMRYNPDWNLGGGIGMYPQYLPALSEAGTRGIETFSYDVDVHYSPEAWRGRIRASAGIAALASDAADEFDKALGELLSAWFPSNVLLVPHRVFAIVAESTRR
ncbi:MAG: class I SAM-dependent methyltransferase [Woeseiaceae bacterium]|nr:class I SAM-dependent methyltransferase [Woeseiaceae bacterium]